MRERKHLPAEWFPRRWLLAMVACLLAFSGTAYADAAGVQAGVEVKLKVTTGGITITTNGTAVDFGTLNIAAVGQTVTAISAPSLTLSDASGTGAGWNVTLQSSNLTDGTGVIAANPYIKFNPIGGTITVLNGQAIDGTNGPRETNTGTQSLGTPVRAVSTNIGYGQGVYRYSPAPSSLSLTMPAGLSVGTGDFQGALTATILSGP